MFDVDKLPGAAKTKLVSLALFLGRRTSLQRWRVEGIDCELLLLHVGGRDVIGSTVTETETETGKKKGTTLTAHSFYPVSLSSQLSLIP